MQIQIIPNPATAVAEEEWKDRKEQEQKERKNDKNRDEKNHTNTKDKNNTVDKKDEKKSGCWMDRPTWTTEEWQLEWRTTEFQLKP